MEKENIEKIMEEYKSKMQNLESENQENTAEQNRIKLHIEKLEEERDELNPITEKSLYEEYNKSIEKAKKELDEFKVSIAKTDEEKKQEKIAKLDLQSDVIKKLTLKKQELDNKIEVTDSKLKYTRIKAQNTDIVYDENHNIIDSSEYQKTLEEISNIEKELDELEDAKKICENYLSEVKAPSKEEEEKIKTINSILNGTYDEIENIENEPKTIEPETVEKETVEQEIESKVEPTEETKTELETEPEETIKTEIKPKPTKISEVEEKTKFEEATVSKVEPETKKEPVTEVKPKEKTAKEKLEDSIEEIKGKIEKAKDPVMKKGYMAMLKVQQENLEKIKEREESEKKLTNKSVNTSDVKKELEEQNITKIDIIAYDEGTKNRPFIKYEVDNNKKYNDSNVNYYESETKNELIKGYLKEIYPEMSFKSNEGLQELKKYEKADVNIVKILKSNKKLLNDYISRLNGIDIENNDYVKISYDISKLSKSNISKEEKKQIEKNAYEHRNIAKVKKNLLQSIKFAFWNFNEKRNNDKITKSFPITKTPVKSEDLEEGITPESAKTIENMINEKHFKEKYKVNDGEMKFPEVSDLDPDLAKKLDDIKAKKDKDDIEH